MKLKDRIAIVTGASSGNGRAIAIALAEQGAKVVCSDIKEQALADGYEEDKNLTTVEVIKKLGGEAIYVSADVGNVSDMQNLINECVTKFGRLDIMVNNAGIFRGLKNILDETEEDYDLTMKINAKGVWLGMKYAIAQFMKQDPIVNLYGDELRGKIVNVASIGGLVGLANEPAYCASKGAVVNLTREVAIDFAKEKINVNAICPGFLATSMVRPFLESDDTNQLLHDLTPWPRVGNVRDVSQAVLFLASDESHWMTGSMLTVDGGFTAR